MMAKLCQLLQSPLVTWSASYVSAAALFHSHVQLLSSSILTAVTNPLGWIVYKQEKCNAHSSVCCEAGDCLESPFFRDSAFSLSTKREGVNNLYQIFLIEH